MSRYWRIIDYIFSILVDGQAKPSANIQQQTPTQALQPAAAAPSAVATLVRSRFHWSHAVIAVGLLAASGAGTAVLIKVLHIDLSIIKDFLFTLLISLQYLVNVPLEGYSS